MNNNIIDKTSLFNGLNLNPIPLEFSQSMTTTKWLLGMENKLSTIIESVNNWYDEIVKDLEGNGVLYQELNDKFLSNFGGDILTLQNSIGNINNSINNLYDLITALQYVKPSVTLSSSPSINLYAVGDTVNSIMLNFNIIKGSNNLVKAEIYKNGSLLTTINTIQNGVNNYVDGTPMTADTNYYVKIYDDKGNVQSETINFTFVYKAFYGKVANNISVNDALIQSLNSVKFQNQFSFNVTLNDEKIIIASHDILQSIIDSENYDMIDSFDLTTLNINVNNVQTPYNIYTSKNLILDNNVTLNIEK